MRLVHLALPLAALLLPVGAFAQTVEIDRGQTSVALDLETLEAVGLTLTGVSDDVIVPGSLGDSVAFPINRRDAEAPLLPTTFSYDPTDFLGSFMGTIEHAGTLDFDLDESPITIGNFTVGYDAGRVSEAASGFFVASTVGLVAILFDVAVAELEPTATSLEIGGDLLVSPELAAALGDTGLTGAVVGEYEIDAAPDVEIAGGRTSVVLDTEALEGAGLSLSGVSEDVIVPGTLEGSVAFGINPRDADPLPTTFAFAPDDFLGTFSGTIEHAGSVFFNEDSVEVGDFTIGFDAERASETNSGFFVASNAGIAAPLFDVASAGLEVDPRETGLSIEGDLLVSPELAGVLGDSGLTGADVGDFLVEGFASVPIEVAAGQTNVALDTEALEGAGLSLSGLSEDVIVPGTIEGSVAFPINARDAMAPALPTTFTYDPTDFLGSFAGTIEHMGSVFFNEDAVEVGDFTIAFDAGRAADGRSGFFVASTVGVVAPLFDVAATDLEVEPTDTSLEIEGDLLVSAELAGVLGDSGLAGADVGDFKVEAAPTVVPEPGAVAAGVAVLGALAILRRRAA